MFPFLSLALLIFVMTVCAVAAVKIYSHDLEDKVLSVLIGFVVPVLVIQPILGLPMGWFDRVFSPSIFWLTVFVVNAVKLQYFDKPRTMDDVYERYSQIENNRLDGSFDEEVPLEELLTKKKRSDN